MKIKNNISLRDRSKITLSDFKGLDSLSSVVDVSAIHASDMKNLISRDGINHKRYGWETQYRLRTSEKFPSIKGIFDFKINAISFLMVYANKQFWLVDRDSGKFYDITKTRIIVNDNAKAVVDSLETLISPVNSDLLIDSECKFFINGDKVYFIGCGDFLVFSKWKNECYELRRVIGNEDVYIPTTTENIDCEEVVEKRTRITAEEVNLLCPYIKNSLFGRDKMEYSEDENVYDKATYTLDVRNFYNVEVEIEKKDGTKVLLNQMFDHGEYSTNDNHLVKNTRFNDFNFRIEDVSFKNVIQEKWFSPRWHYYEEAERAGFGKVVLTKENWNEKQDDLKNPFNGEKYPDYQYYLDIMYQYYLGIMSPKGTIKTCLIPLTFIKDIEIAKFKDSSDNREDKLLYRVETTKLSEEIPIRAINGVSLKYQYPTQLTYKLIYSSSSNETKLAEYNRDFDGLKIEDTNAIQIKTDDSDEDDKDFILTFENDFEYALLKKQKLVIACDKQEINLTEYNVKLSSCLEGVNFVNYNAYTIKDEKGLCECCVDSENGTLCFKAVADDPSFYSPKFPNIPNIIVKIDVGSNEKIITYSTLGVKFGTQGTTDRLFVVSSNGSTIYWSKDNDFTYFGNKSWCACGTSETKITGVDRLNDKTLLIVKEFSLKEPSIYVISGTTYSGKTEADTAEYTTIFTPSGFQVGMGAVGSVTNFNGDCLMVAKDGIYAISFGENMTVDSRYITHRSKQISNILEKFDLSKTKCVSYNGKYFIAINNNPLYECFVADSNYKTLFSNDDGQVNYEWWRWTNIPVSVWAFVDNELWFGTKDGQLCKFSKNFYDEEKTFFELGSNLVGYNTDEDTSEITGFTLSNDIEYATGDMFTFDCDFYKKITTNKFYFNQDETKIYFNLPLTNYLNGEEIVVNETAFKITIEEDNLTFSIDVPKEYKDIFSKNNEITFYKNIKGLLFKIEKCKNSNELFTLLLKENNGKDNVVFAPVLTELNSKGLNPDSSNFKGHLIRRKPVVAEWKSGALDLGTRQYEKTLLFICLTGEKDLSNHLKYGIITRLNKSNDELLRANNDLEWQKLDLNTFSIDSQFASSYTKRLNIRNVNFVMLYFCNEHEEDLALNSIQIEFKLIKRNIGVK